MPSATNEAVSSFSRLADSFPKQQSSDPLEVLAHGNLFQEPKVGDFLRRSSA